MLSYTLLLKNLNCRINKIYNFHLTIVIVMYNQSQNLRRSKQRMIKSGNERHTPFRFRFSFILFSVARIPSPNVVKNVVNHISRPQNEKQKSPKVHQLSDFFERISITGFIISKVFALCHCFCGK